MPKNFIKTKVDIKVAVAVVLIVIAIGVSASIATLIPTVGSGKFYGSGPTPGIGYCNLKTALKDDGTHPDCQAIEGGLYCIADDQGLGKCVQCLENKHCVNSKYVLIGETYPGDVCNTSQHSCSCNSSDDCSLVGDAHCKRDLWYDGIQQKPFDASPATGSCRVTKTMECSELRSWLGDFHPKEAIFSAYFDEWSYSCERLRGQPCGQVINGGRQTIPIPCESRFNDLTCCVIKSMKAVASTSTPI